MTHRITVTLTDAEYAALAIEAAKNGKAVRERLAHLFGQGKAASEMVIEDRGPGY